MKNPTYFWFILVFLPFFGSLFPVNNNNGESNLETHSFDDVIETNIDGEFAGSAIINLEE